MLLYGKYMLNVNKVFNFEERLDTINKLTLDDALAAIEIMFDEKNKAVSLVGNTDEAFAL